MRVQRWLTPIYEIPQNFHCDSVSHVNVASSDVTQVPSICMASLIASLSWSGGCWSPSWEFHSSARHKRTSVFVRLHAAGEDKIAGGKAAAAPAVNCPPIRAGCRYYYLTSKVNCINSDWLLKALSLLQTSQKTRCFLLVLMPVERWFLVTGLRFLEQTCQRISASPLGARKGLKMWRLHTRSSM